MDKERIVWGIIGCGDVAEVKSGPAFQKCESSQLLAVMRRDGDKAKDFARRHIVPLWYDDASLLLNNDDIDAVYIATPPSSHVAYALMALEAGKDVYLEKPMVRNQAEAIELERAFKNGSSKLVVAHYRRQLPMYLKIKQLLKHKMIGKVETVDLKFFKKHDTKMDTAWRLDPEVSGGGLFFDISPHQLDMMYHWFGDFDVLQGFAANQANDNAASDLVNGHIHFKNGVQFNGLWNFNVEASLEEDRCHIHGSEGVISFSFFDSELRLISNSRSETFKFENPVNIQQPFIQETTDYFLGKRSNPCSVSEGRVVSQIMDAFTK